MGACSVLQPRLIYQDESHKSGCCDTLVIELSYFSNLGFLFLSWESVNTLNVTRSSVVSTDILIFTTHVAQNFYPQKVVLSLFG